MYFFFPFFFKLTSHLSRFKWVHMVQQRSSYSDYLSLSQPKRKASLEFDTLWSDWQDDLKNKLRNDQVRCHQHKETQGKNPRTEHQQRVNARQQTRFMRAHCDTSGMREPDNHQNLNKGAMENSNNFSCSRVWYLPRYICSVWVLFLVKDPMQMYSNAFSWVRASYLPVA